METKSEQQRYGALDALPDYVAALENGFHVCGDLTLRTNLTDIDSAKFIVDKAHDDMSVHVKSFGWCHDGLAFDFHTFRDFCLFALAFSDIRV